MQEVMTWDTLSFICWTVSPAITEQTPCQFSTAGKRFLCKIINKKCWSI